MEWLIQLYYQQIEVKLLLKVVHLDWPEAYIQQLLIDFQSICVEVEDNVLQLQLSSKLEMSLQEMEGAVSPTIFLRREGKYICFGLKKNTIV